MRESEPTGIHNDDSSDDGLKAALAMMMTAAGESDWHVSTRYEEPDMAYAIVIRPDYDYDDRPWAGDAIVHALYSDNTGHVDEVAIKLPSAEVARIARQYLALLDADQQQFERGEDAAEEDEDEEEEEDEDDEEEDEDDEDDDEDEEEEEEG